MQANETFVTNNLKSEIFVPNYLNLGSGLESMDPSERLEFSAPTNLGIQRFDLRDDQTLKETALEHSSSLERERAFWEFADRNRELSLSLLEEIAKNDSSPEVRWSALWAIQKFGGRQSLEIINPFINDEHPEVKDWAHLLISEMTGQVSKNNNVRGLKFDETNEFSQTLPLMIAGYARVQVPNLGWFQATLSPQWFESIMGRVMACTCEDTFEKDLIIEKCIWDYYLGGENHYEIFKFGGLSSALSPEVMLHTYESKAQHPFFPSGKVGDLSKGQLDDVYVTLNRVASTAGNLFDGRHVINSVRGRYMGMAYINLERVISNEMTIGPGEVQLSSIHHPIAGPLTNTFLFGTFKGKLSDLDGDGQLDVNTEHSRGTLDGQLKTSLS